MRTWEFDKFKVLILTLDVWDWERLRARDNGDEYDWYEDDYDDDDDIDHDDDHHDDDGINHLGTVGCVRTTWS